MVSDGSWRLSRGLLPHTMRVMPRFAFFLASWAMVALPGAEPEVEQAAAAAEPPREGRSESGRAPEPTAEYLWLPATRERDGEARVGQGELRLRLGAPPWWRSGDGRYGSVLGAGYARIDPQQTDADLPDALQSIYLNSVTWLRFNDHWSTSLVITPGVRTADSSLTWKDTRLFAGAFATWKYHPQIEIGFGAISTSNHRRTVVIPTASVVLRPSHELAIWFQGIAAQVRWSASPRWTFGGSYSLLSSLDFQLPEDDPDGEIILMRDVRVLGNVQWHATRHVALGALAGMAFNRRWEWQGDGPTRDDLRLAPTPVLGLNLFLTF